MKKISVAFLSGIFMVLALLRASAQDKKVAFVEPYRLSVTYNKTTNLVFPYAIKSIDRGSRDIIVQKAIGVENVLQVKASRQLFTETNLTVMTADGSFYSYLLTYADTPTNLSFLVTNTNVHPQPVAVFTKDATNDEIQSNAKLISVKNRSLEGNKDESFGIVMDVKGLYIHGDVIYFQIDLQNRSSINYDAQLLRLYIADRKKSKRTASQELDLKPLFIWGNTEQIPAGSTETIVLALPKFTIPDRKFLAVQLMEQNGGRNLFLKVTNKKIMKASAI